MTARGNCALNALVGTVPGVLLQAREPDTFLKIIKVSPSKAGPQERQEAQPTEEWPAKPKGRAPGERRKVWVAPRACQRPLKILC